MRIVIDMQGAQSTGSRTRGIGRYTMAFAKAMVNHRGEHEIILALSGLFPDTIEPIRAAFDGLLPQENIRVWHAPGPVSEIQPGNDDRREAAEIVREAFLASLQPDVIHISSLFEGLGDDAVTSIGRFDTETPVSVTLYDLIPLIHRRPYLENPAVESWYFRKLDHLRRARLWLAISESSRQEGIDHLGLPSEWVVNVGTDTAEHYRPMVISPAEEQRLRQKYGLSKPFIMYTGGIDHRKNIEGLITAFARLPKPVRRGHQLAIVCQATEHDRHRLLDLAKRQGIKPSEVVLTGFVPDQELVCLYNLCQLFAFPSWHEGFGLPVLEAMRCGAPVIGSNTSSIPEVIGLEKALFDPFDVDAIATKMAQALEDEDFRETLRKHGLEQAKKFSWDESAKRALATFERLHTQSKRVVSPGRRPRLAYVSPLPPEQSGISDYSAELLPELARHYEVELIVDQAEVSDSYLRANFPVRTVEDLRTGTYDRVLYHFGNSAFHQHMFGLLEEIPGLVVLHDFFLSGIQDWREIHLSSPHAFAKALLVSHGYHAARERYSAQKLEDVIWRYPANLPVLQRALGVIVHSEHSCQLARSWYGDKAASDWAVIPHLRQPVKSKDKRLARRRLGIAEDDFLVCSFGIVGPTKLNHRLLQAWLALPLARSPHCRLVFVGQNHGGDYGQQLLQTIAKSGAKKRIAITGWTDRETFQTYLEAADVAVQLRSLSRGETSGTVLDCLAHGIPIIVNAHGSAAELPADTVWMLPDEFTDAQLGEALMTMYEDGRRRAQLGQRMREYVSTHHHPRRCADAYAEAIERFYHRAKFGLPGVVQALTKKPLAEDHLQKLAKDLARNHPPSPRPKQLLVDISELVQRDACTGIQRVVRNILNEWLLDPPEGYRVEPVYATVDRPYCYARSFTAKFLGIAENILPDDPIDYAAGDVFLALDLQPQVVPARRMCYQALRSQGVKVTFVVYDLLCVLMPQYFVPGTADGFTRWLEVVAESDGAVCISQSVARELGDWIGKNGPERLRPFHINWFHLGAEFDHLHPTKGFPPNVETTLDQLQSRPTFLMVGTLEPRKAHAQVLAAFEQLWGDGVDVNLAIVGKQGWMVEELVEQLRRHPEMGKRLFWLEAISDEYLEKVYAASTCLIAASYGEGFGLPLIEAAQHKLPIIARDIPVFREVAGEHAFYFEANTPVDLVQVVKTWLNQYHQGRHPKSDAMPWQTWGDSAAQLLNIILNKGEFLC